MRFNESSGVKMNEKKMKLWWIKILVKNELVEDEVKNELVEDDDDENHNSKL